MNVCLSLFGAEDEYVVESQVGHDSKSFRSIIIKNKINEGVSKSW